MSSTREYADFIRSRFERLDVVSIKPMMGEYVIHMAGKVLGFIGDNCLMLEPGPTVERLLPDARRRELFPGSKLFIVVDDSVSASKLCEIAVAIYEDLPISRPRKKKSSRDKGMEETEVERRFPFVKQFKDI